MANYYYGNGHNRHHSRRHRRSRLPLFLLIALILLILAGTAFGLGRLRAQRNIPAETTPVSAESSEEGDSNSDSGSLSDASAENSDSTPEAAAASPLDALLQRAELLAVQYDYDAAIACIQDDAEAAASEAGAAAIRRYEEIKSTLVRQNPQEITHVFFHTLIMDTAKAFDGDSRQNGYNDVMTTKSEFEKMMQAMYERGYVLVSIRDIAYEVEDTEKGGKKMVYGDIMLPEGKKAFVLSQDDVNYYEYMDGDGFAKCLIVGEDGKPTNEMLMDDGSVSVGSYDVVPILDDFIEEHPDFSYRGAKGIVAVTGYNGVFGYRTDDSYAETNPNIEADRQRVREVAQCLRDDGWELASHSWGHRNYGTISMNELHADSKKWQDRVATLIGGSDILIYPFGGDVADWHPYTVDNERFSLLWGQGFRYFCNVDSSPYFVQKGNDFMRMGRRNLDGYRMWQDMTVKNHTSDLFNAADIFDEARPTPVPDYNGG
ncbi:MAG: polysaccharide deacetylase [Stomatobaculum sp.]